VITYDDGFTGNVVVTAPILQQEAKTRVQGSPP
jgi:hypothetical protein